MLIGLLDAALWAGVVVVSKQLLRFVDPVVLNLLARLVTLLTLLVVGVPLVAAGVVPLGFAVTWEATGYIALTAVVSWFLGYTCYLYALRMGDISVVAPVGATDPVWTGLFAFALLGAPLGGFLVAGLLCTTAGVAAVTYFMEVRAAPVALPAEAAGPAGGSPVGGGTGDDNRSAGGDAAPDDGRAAGAGNSRRSRPGRRVQVAVLATTAAAAWGLATILIQQAIESTGGASLTLVLLYEAFGCLLLAPLAWRRRSRAFRDLNASPAGREVRRLPDRQGGRFPGGRGCLSERRGRLLGLLAAGGALDSLFIVLFYVVVEQLGAVLTNIAIATSPIFSIAGGLLFFRERIGLKLALAIALTLAGVFLAVLGG